MPIDLTGDITDQVLQLFHEFKNKYGNDVKLELDVTLEDNGSETPLRLDSSRGIVIGSTDDVSVLLLFKASNDTVQGEPALELRMNLEAALNINLN